MELFLVRTHDVPSWWPAAGPLLAQALDASAGESDLGTLYGRLTGPHHDQHLMLGVDEGSRVRFAATFLVVRYDRFSALRVVLAAGEPMSEWIGPVVDRLEDICQQLGLAQVEFFGRPGFQRALRDWASHTYTVMVRKVKDERRERDDHHRADERAVGAR